MDEPSGTPIQFGPGLETIWPTTQLTSYERQARCWHDRIRQARSVLEIEEILRQASVGSRIVSRTVARAEIRHVEYQFETLIRLAGQRAQMLKYERSPDGALVGRWVCEKQPGGALDLVEYEESYARSRIGSPGAAARGGAVAGAEILDPLSQPQFAQGMARPHGWRAVGKHPGYRC